MRVVLFFTLSIILYLSDQYNERSIRKNNDLKYQFVNERIIIMREVVTEKIFSGEEDLIQISTEDRLWDLVDKMKRLEKYIPCVINDVAVI